MVERPETPPLLLSKVCTGSCSQDEVTVSNCVTHRCLLHPPLYCTFSVIFTIPSPAERADALWYHLPTVSLSEAQEVVRPHQLKIGFSMESAEYYPQVRRSFSLQDGCTLLVVRFYSLDYRILYCFSIDFITPIIYYR
jgi:hypothetical protein